MKRSKSDDESVDRLSELPESLILEILSSLEMRDVVRTSLISKRWRDVWSTTPYLCFDESERNPVQTRNFINRVLVRWKGMKIKKFIIRLREEYDNSLFDDSLFGDMDFWIRFAVEWKVEELYIGWPYSHRPNYKESDPVYLPPYCLYSCSSITKLWLIGLNLDQMKVNNLGLQWNQLKNLRIHGYHMSEDVINQVVSSTPHLEILKVLFVGSGHNLSIRSSSLKELHLLNLWSDKIRFDYDPSNYATLTIWAPNLQVLAINSNAAYRRCLLMDVSSLTEANLKVVDTCEVAVEQTLKQFLPPIQHVEALTLSLCCFKIVPYVMRQGKYSCSFWKNVKKLKLIGGPIEACDIINVVEYFPKVEKLVIDWRPSEWGTRFIARLSSKKYDLQYYSSCNDHIINYSLTRVEITWYSYDVAAIFELIQFLLKHATNLQTIVQIICIKQGGKQGMTQLEEQQFEQQLDTLEASFPALRLFVAQKYRLPI